MKQKTIAQLIRRANQLLKEQTVLVAELQKLKAELLQRNREINDMHERFKRNKPR